MKVFLILLLLIAQTITYGQRSFKLKGVKDEELASLVMTHAGLKEINSDDTEIRIWTGSNLIHLEVNANQVLRAQLTEFKFAIDRRETIKRCYYNNVLLSAELAAAILTKLNEIDTIPSSQAITDWIAVLDDNSYGIEIINKGTKIEKSYYALFSQTTDRVKGVKDFFKFIDTYVLVHSKLKLPSGEYMDLNRNIVIRVL